MLHLINKFAPYIAIGVIGCLAYSSFETTGVSLAGEEKEVPSISAKLLSPKFIEPVNHASPANRDPFVIGTDGRFTSAYLNGTEGTNNKNSGDENINLICWCKDAVINLLILLMESFQNTENILLTNRYNKHRVKFF